MRKLLGYCAHLASCRLHEVAVGLLSSEPFELIMWFGRPVIEVDARDADSCPLLEPEPITLNDVAPRLAAAIEAVRDRIARTR